MKDALDTWRVGDVVITRIADLEIADFPTQLMFEELTNAQVSAVEWLQPHYATPEGNIRVSYHAYVVETQGVRVIVDTCVGNDKPRYAPYFARLSTGFMERLAAAGFPPDDIDFVLCSHLHFDHIGWNTHWDGEAWVPTFPKARYLFGRTEWDHWRHEIDHAPASDDETRGPFRESVEPILKAGLHDLIETDLRITDEVRLFPTPGHTPGHVSVAILSGEQEAVILGDVLHHPIQLAHTWIQSHFDSNRSQAQATRRAFIENHADREVLILGSHFAKPTAGWIVRDGAAWRFASSPK